jgi:hypothetical protein
MQIRTSANSSEIALSLVTGTRSLVIEPLTGKVEVLLTPAQTEALAAGIYTYDIELESPDGDVTKFIAGKFTVRAEITY